MYLELSVLFFDEERIYTICVSAAGSARDVGHGIAISVADRSDYRTSGRLDGDCVGAGLQDGFAPVDLVRRSERPA